jgi:ferredoxin
VRTRGRATSDAGHGWMAMTLRIVADWIACDGRGVCAELFPERITLDEWGFPIISGAAITPELEPHARRAVAACPLLALKLIRD